MYYSLFPVSLIAKFLNFNSSPCKSTYLCHGLFFFFILQCMIHDLIASLELQPPPFLNAVVLPYPYKQTTSEHPSRIPGEPNMNSSDTNNLYCAHCAWSPTPHRQRRLFLLRNLCAALSTCIHQCLSTGGWFGPGQTQGRNSNSLGAGGIALPANGSMNIRSGRYQLPYVVCVTHKEWVIQVMVDCNWFPRSIFCDNGLY